MHRAARLSCPLSGAGDEENPLSPDRPSKIVLVQVGTLSSPHPSFGGSVFFLFRHSESTRATRTRSSARSSVEGALLAYETHAGCPKGLRFCVEQIPTKDDTVDYEEWASLYDVGRRDHHARPRVGWASVVRVHGRRAARRRAHWVARYRGQGARGRQKAQAGAERDRE